MRHEDIEEACMDDGSNHGVGPGGWRDMKPAGRYVMSDLWTA